MGLRRSRSTRFFACAYGKRKSTTEDAAKAACSAASGGRAGRRLWRHRDEPALRVSAVLYEPLELAPTHENVLGVLSLIVWSLFLIVFVRYIGMVMRVAHDGEGGILALLAFVLPPAVRGVPPRATWLTFLILTRRRNALRRRRHYAGGLGALLGRGLERGDVVGAAVYRADCSRGPGGPVPLSTTRNGPHRLGLRTGDGALVRDDRRARNRAGSSRYPAVLYAIDPLYIARFFAHHGFAGITIFGAIVLCVSGVEALYADMSHFGRGPIAMAWTSIVFPALALNYAGRARWCCRSAALENPFYKLVPPSPSTRWSGSRPSPRSSPRKR